MFKPCPHCGFLVALIAGREASQRCPRCGSALVGENETFDAPDEQAPRRRRRDRADGVPAPAPAPPTHADEVREPVAAAHSTDEPDVEVEVEVRDDQAPAASPPAEAAPSSEDNDGPTHDGPSFVRRRTRIDGPRRRRWPWIAAVTALSLLLALQLLLAQRNELARDAAWRPLVVQACGVLGCDVPAWHEPRAWRMLARGVRPDPARPGVLHVAATLRNDAAWPQRPPTVVLSLSDIDGRLVGARAVMPRDFGRAPTETVAPGHSVDVAFDVREPSGRVESFDFQLQ